MIAAHALLGRAAAPLLAWATAASLLSPLATQAQTSTSPAGQWSKLASLPAFPVHNHLLPNGKVLTWSRSATGTQPLWDPASGTVTGSVPSAGYDLFCSGHTYLGDGRLLVAGGHIADNVGLPKASVYDPVTNTWLAAPDMNAGRWYPTVTTLPNGDALVVSGNVNTTVGVNTLPQVYQAGTNTWRNLTGAQLGQWYYPMMFVAPNGKVFDAAPTVSTRYLDTSGTGAWSYVGEHKLNVGRDYGSAVMYAPGKILVVGGADPATATAEVIDLNQAAPAWRSVASMQAARRHLNATMLPDGTVLVTGGSSTGDYDTTKAVYSTELWNPATETWTRLASGTVPRLYHSAAVLLPDGRVLTTGGDNFPDVEVFSPPYLFKGTRPAISAAPAAIAYGQRFTVSSPDAAGIARVTMIPLASVTHAFNMHQRFNELQFTAGTTAGTVDVTPPANANLAPPGPYMLFVLDANGVPSVGSIVKVGTTASDPTPTQPPPAAAPALSSLSPQSATAGGPAFALTANGSNFVSGSTVRWNGADRPTTFVSSAQLRADIPSTDIAAAGTAQVSVATPAGAASGTLPFTIAASTPPPVATNRLTVTRSGPASTRGTITSSPSGISCGSTCNATFATTVKTVTLSVATNGNGVFAGWSGACTGTAPTCTVTMDGNKSVTATINLRK